MKKHLGGHDLLLKDFGVFHHIGIAVKDFKKNLKFYSSLGYSSSSPVVDRLQNVQLVMLTAEKYPDIELVKPLNNESPIHGILKNKDVSIYHFCYEVSDIKKTVQAIEKNHRIICVSQETPAILFGDRKVAFFYIDEVGIVELLEGPSDEK